MALTFADMQIEVLERLKGVDIDGTIRVRRWINAAMHQIDEMERWDYLAASTTGAAPLTIADLRTVESVIDVANLNPLVQIDRRSLADTFADLTTTNSLPSFWYKTSATTIAVYPVSTVTLTVRYFKFGPDLVVAADAPLMPDRFREVIVELACAKAFRDARDRDSERDCLDEVSRLLDPMRQALVLAPEYVPRLSYSLDD